MAGSGIRERVQRIVPTETKEVFSLENFTRRRVHRPKPVQRPYRYKIKNPRVRSLFKEEPNDSMEFKAIRYVRTPAGVRKYGQPIGSIIVRDSVLKKIRVVDTYEGWQELETANRKKFWLGPDPDAPKKWVITDKNDVVKFEGDKAEDLLIKLNNSIPAAEHFEFAQTRKMTAKERAAALPKRNQPKPAPKTGRTAIDAAIDEFGEGSHRHEAAVRKHGLDNVKRQKSNTPGWEQYRDADGRDYWVAPDDERDGEWMIVDKNDNVLVDRLPSKAGALERMNTIAGDTVKQSAIEKARAKAPAPKPKPVEAPSGVPKVEPVTDVASVPEWYGGVSSANRAAFDKKQPASFFLELSKGKSRVRVQTTDGTILDGVYAGGKNVGGKPRAGIKPDGASRVTWIDPQSVKLAWGEKEKQSADTQMRDAINAIRNRKPIIGAPQPGTDKTRELGGAMTSGDTKPVRKMGTAQARAWGKLTDDQKRKANRLMREDNFSMQRALDAVQSPTGVGFARGRRVNTEQGPGEVVDTTDRSVTIRLDGGTIINVQKGTYGMRRLDSLNAAGSKVPDAADPEEWSKRQARLVLGLTEPANAFTNTTAQIQKREEALRVALESATPAQKEALKRQLSRLLADRRKAKDNRSVGVLNLWLGKVK